MRISLPRIPSRWEIVEDLFQSQEPFNTNCNSIYEDCMQLFHDDYFDSSDEEPWEEASDQEEWTTPFKPMRDISDEIVILTPVGSPDFLSAAMKRLSSEEPKYLVPPMSIPTTPKLTSSINMGLLTPTASPTLFGSSEWNKVGSSHRHPTPSDKDQWFESWDLEKHTTYDIKHRLPSLVHKHQIQVDISGLSHTVFYDAQTAVMKYEDPGRYVQGVVRVHVRAPDFELHDGFVVFNGYPSPPLVPQTFAYGPYIGEVSSLLAAKKNSKAKGKGTTQVNAEKESTSEGTGEAQTNEFVEDEELIKWLQANNVDMKFPPLFTYLYEFRPANTDLRVQSIVIIDSGAAASQNSMMFQPPCPPRVSGHGKVYDSTGALTLRRYGAGRCFPVNRVRPNTPDANPCRVGEWTVVGDNQKFFNPDSLARVQEHTTIEPICVENGPLLVGLGNFMRWNLMVHPRTGLEMAV